MGTRTVLRREWREFLLGFSRKHSGWLVSIETHDLKTGETVTSHLVRPGSVELDREDKKNPRINVIVRDEDKEIKHIFFRPSDLKLYVSEDGNDEGLRIVSLNTVTTVRFRVAASPELVDGVA